jgi:hypothetical protein
MICRKCLAVIVMLVLLGSVASAQVFWTVYPDPVPLDQPVVLKIQNQMRSTIQLPSSAPWSMYDGQGKLIFSPMSMPVMVPVAPLASQSWTWKQKDNRNQSVPAGPYEARITYWLGSQQYPLKTPFQIDQVTMATGGKPTPGGQIQFNMHAPTSTGMPYQMACSLGAQPGIPLPGNRLLALNPDGLFYLSLLAPPPIFQNFSGITSKSGYATGLVNVPNTPVLIGITLYGAGVTLHPSAPGGIHVYSTSRSVQIQ